MSKIKDLVTGNGKDSDLNKKRIEELLPVVKEITDIIASSGLKIGDTHARENDKYNAVSKKVLEVMLKYNVKYVDKEFLFQLILEPFGIVQEIVSRSLGDAFDRALDKAFGKEFRSIRLENIDALIKKDIPKV